MFPMSAAPSGSPTPDPFKLIEAVFPGTDPTLTRDEYNLAPFTQVHPALVGGESTAIIITGGDSISCNSVNSSYTVTQSRNHVICLDNGAMYPPRGTLLGCNTSPAAGSNYASRLADNIITGGAKARVILFPIGKGGTLFARFASGGDCNHRINVAAARLAALGLAATNIAWEQGPNDTNAGTVQATCEANLNSIRASFTAAGITAPMYVAKRSKFGGSTGTAVRAAQAAVVNGS